MTMWPGIEEEIRRREDGRNTTSTAAIVTGDSLRADVAENQQEVNSKGESE